MNFYINYHHSTSDCEMCGSYSSEHVSINNEDKSFSIELGSYASCFDIGTDVDITEPFEKINEYLTSIQYSNIPELPKEPEYDDIENMLMQVQYQTHLLDASEKDKLEEYQNKFSEFEKTYSPENIIKIYDSCGIKLVIETTSDTDDDDLYYNDDDFYEGIDYEE